MTAPPPTLRLSTPGRLCLFGEHQDYLNLPVIPCAISLRLAIEGKRRNDARVHLALPDINSEVSFSLAGPLAYQEARDYFRSAVNVLRRAGLTFSTGFDAVVRSEIPRTAGTSSSSALVVTWVNFLAQMSDQQQALAPEELARYAHAAEVLEFHEPGGMMDQYSTACGGVLALTFHPTLHIEKFTPPLKSFVLGDSQEPKDTKGILSRVKGQLLNLIQSLAARYPDFSLYHTPLEKLDHYTRDLNAEQRQLLWATLRNRDITQEALSILRAPIFDDLLFGELLNEHQMLLRDIHKISTPKIDRMIHAALRAGAYGGKITGSGGGGCMFVYTPKNPEAVAQAIEKAGGKAFIVGVDSGARNEATS
jgi:galactokinase